MQHIIMIMIFQGKHKTHVCENKCILSWFAIFLPFIRIELNCFFLLKYYYIYTDPSNNIVLAHIDQLPVMCS